MAQQSFGGWTFGNPDPESPIAFWYDGNGNVSFKVPDAALKAAAKGPNAVQNMMWMTGGDFTRVKQLGLLGENADWNQLGQQGADWQAAQDSDFSLKELAVPAAIVTAGALGLGPSVESFFGLGGAEGLAGAVGTDALLGSAGADTLAAGGASGLSEAELAALIESGTVGAEGAALEAGAGITSGGALSGGGAAALSGGGAAAGGTALSKLSEITGLDEGTLQLLGIGAGTGLGIYGADQKSDALTDIANNLRADRRPFLDKSIAYLNNPQAFLEGPGKASMDAVLRALSVKGNPTGLPSSLDLAADASMRNWLGAVTNLGSLGTGGEGIQAQLQAGAADADSDVLDAIGYGVGTVTNPPRSLEDLIRQARRGSGLSLV